MICHKKGYLVIITLKQYMNYWICIINRENWEIVKDKNIWGVSEKHKNIISKIKIGDKMVFYITKEMIFGGIYEAVSEAYQDKSRLFESITADKIEIFPYRIRITPIKVAKEPVEIKVLISNLEFITNKKTWRSYLFGKAMRNLSKKDYAIIESNMG